MIELTQEQRQQIRQANGAEVRFRDPEADREYVILPAEI